MPAILLLLLSLPCGLAAQDRDFPSWLDQLRLEALDQGLSTQTLDQALTGLRPLPRILTLEESQPEHTINLATYLRRVVPASRVKAARQRLAKHRPLLEEIGARYGVQPQYLVALWAVESDFGRNMGKTPVVGALATLAHGAKRPHRRELFRTELLAALRILDQRTVAPEQLVGSWAGAMGQCQFMPTNYLTLAVDYDQNQRRDIWREYPDVFASIAHFLSQNGWAGDQTWGREVRLPPGFDLGLIGLEVDKPLPAWQELGVRRADGGDLPARDLSASLVRPDQGRAFLVYGNFRVLREWNRSSYFALAIGELADRLTQ
ncbi:MAG: lytic murein transglycosylase [Candidatus Handelsmanbacteria bacterium]|nr:lytic murein transglycosylase [Candidatus Handelsmanbacteria bacterium]